MKILVAPDSFKSSLFASQVAVAMEEGIRAVLPQVQVTRLPLSDGGEGLVDALVSASGGEFVTEEVTDPLGRPVSSYWGLMGDKKTAVIEMAAASGLPLLDENERNPMVTTTYGTGQLIKAALDRGCRKLIIGIGGSATNDGGGGMAQALGASLVDEEGRELPFGGGYLHKLRKIDLSGMDSRLKNTRIRVACDVNNPLTGSRGASSVYGPQKGATPDMVEKLDRALKHYAQVIYRDLGIDVENVPGSGAAGGLGAGLMAFLNGELTPGIELVMEAVGLEKELKNCSLILTGEGELDAQSIYGKVPVGVARAAKKENVPVVVLAGSVAEDLGIMHREGITACFSIINKPMNLENAMEKTADLVKTAAEEVIRLWLQAKGV